MFEVVLVISTLLVGPVAGLVFAYAVVAMPGHVAGRRAPGT